MTYRHLHHKPQMDTRALVDARRSAMRSVAEAFLAGDAYPSWVYEALRSRGLSRDSAILVEDQTPSEACCPDTFAGQLLDVDRRFLEFEIVLGDMESADRYEEFHVRDVTARTDVRPRIPGIGTSDGWLAIELLEQLQAEGSVRKPE